MKGNVLLKKMVPRKLKERIKREFQSTENKVAYELNISDVRRLQGKTAIVTGGSGGIGSAICFRLAMEGAIVGVCGRNQEKLQLVANNILNNSGKAYPFIMDIVDLNSIEHSFADFYDIYGAIDILINNAGGSARGQSKRFANQSLDIVNNILDTNLRGTMYCSSVALKYMSNKDYGRIINLSSVVGLQGKVGMSDYAAAKSGIVGFSRSLAIEQGENNITVNCVSPGWTERGILDHEKTVKKANVNCLGRTGKADEVAGLVAYLCSEEAGYITGQNIIIDGGRTLGLWGDN